MPTSVAELLNVVESDRDISWLENALQGALELEFATIPLYLSALWSIKDPPKNPSPESAFGLLYGIAMEEMLHLGLVCNMLTTIGGTPRILAGAPSYPHKGLPGGVQPDLHVTLAGLTKKRVANLFMQIEYPEYDVPGTTPPRRAAADYATIGAFYDAIEATFKSLDPPVTGHKQLKATFAGESLNAIKDRSGFVHAIQTIKDQGEGTSRGDPDANIKTGEELAHYFKFGSLHRGNLYVKGPNGHWGYTGKAIPFPDVHSMMEVPAGGYHNPAPPVKKKLDAFNAGFTGVVKDLDTAWAKGEQHTLDDAIAGMFKLAGLAEPLYRLAVPSTSQTYGPTFELVP
jgi:Ferritin-like